MVVCQGAGPIDLSNPCVRESWSAIVPLFITLASLVTVIPLPGPVRHIIHILKRPLTNPLPLSEALALEKGGDVSGIQVQPPVPPRRSVVLSTLALFETLAWLSVGAYKTVTHTGDAFDQVRPFVFAATWMYAFIRPMARPTATPPYDLFMLFVAHLVFDVITFGGALYDHQVVGLPLPSVFIMFAAIANLFVALALLSVVLSMPLAIPDHHVKAEEVGTSISPEDYTTLFGWITFTWIVPLIVRGTNTTLNESDVWDLSPTMKARLVYMKFSAIHRNTLLRRLWAANSLDVLLDFGLAYPVLLFNYLRPLFLKLILDSLAAQDGSHVPQAFIYAVLMFVCTLGRAEFTALHAWYGRRAATRIKSELMVAIFDKALRRKDFSGIVDKDHLDNGRADTSNVKSDDPRAGADVGKIVNLMAVDADRFAVIVPDLYFLCSIPSEIIIATVFLYQLLGWSAFAGFVIVIVGWPLSKLLTQRALHIGKGVSTARDRRMSVVNELITAVKFIKFFAWEDRWIQRVLDAREVEMQWMIKSRINYVLLSLVWLCAPLLVSLTAFFAYVMQGNELTIGTAFTAIALFSMIRSPLSIMAVWIVRLIQAGVSLNRISVFLEEDEVDEQVSTLKKKSVSMSNEPAGGLGLAHATLKWNRVEENKDKGKGKEPAARYSLFTHSGRAEDGSATAVDGTSVAESDEPDRGFKLTDVSAMFPEGELSIITGPTGSGKSALLMALLGEMTLLEGRIIMSKNTDKVDEHGLQHAISYATQTPWLRHQSIKDNVLFGYPLYEERYQMVIECCALKPDLEMLEDGDATEIGARGVSLSGGQKARVALARAIYAPTKYVLLDDPLSAVDSHTARFLFDRLLCGPLLVNRTVILVTHHITLVLPGTYYVVRLLDGRIDTQGTVKELRSRGFLDEITREESVETHRANQAIEAEVMASEALGAAEAAVLKKVPRKLIEDEKRETGRMKWNIYRTYLKASSYWTWAILGFLVVLSQLLGVSEKLWIMVWGDAYAQHDTTTTVYMAHFALSPAHEHPLLYQMVGSPNANSTSGPVISTLAGEWPPAKTHPLFYIGIYALISLAGVLVEIIAIIAQFTGALRASRVLFQNLLAGVVRATMRWHDVTPQGRMLNRFSKDIETVDTSLADSLQKVNSSLATFVASVITVIVVFPLFIFPAMIISYVYTKLAIGYLNTGRDLRRMESNTRSPIFSNFGELLEGIVTVRAFSAEQRFLDNHSEKLDLTNKMWYTFWMTNRWLSLHFDCLGGLAVFVTTLFALSGYVDAGMAGVCITSAMSFTGGVYWACRAWTTLELDLNAVERVAEYLDLPQEPPAIIESSRPPAYWPSSTSSNSDALISVENLVVKYAPELPAVLHNVSFEIKAKERVGLLGRTGSGKSTLAMSLLRFVEPSSGQITVDGIDISKIGLYDLRSRITFIPQDATLFSGTLRENLDPFGEHEDSECLDVLYRVQLITESQLASQRTSHEPSRPSSIHHTERESTIASSVISPTGTKCENKVIITLETQVSPGGANFSQGQRQLIAMARALLRRSAIVILDEATSSIDFETDAKIQAMIREDFNDSALLTVAHRLRTVIDYDRLIVLDKGELVEFDTPWNLIQKEGGIFRGMCLNSGTFAELQAAAKAKFAADAKQDACCHFLTGLVSNNGLLCD